jgi:hypothetical protein
MTDQLHYDNAIHRSDTSLRAPRSLAREVDREEQILFRMQPPMQPLL